MDLRESVYRLRNEKKREREGVERKSRVKRARRTGGEGADTRGKGRK